MEDDNKATRVQTFNVKPSLAHTKKLVNELMAYVEDNKLSVNIAGKKYLQVEAWQFTGSQLGLTAIVTDIEDVTIKAINDLKSKDIPKYKATVEIIHNPTGQLVSRGFALCSKAESKKSSFDEYAVASMAQTRAIGKAYRNILAWLPKLAGYEGTPVEEINEDMRESMTEERNKKRAEVFTKLKANNIIDSAAMLKVIYDAIKKESIDSVDDADRVLLYIETMVEDD